MTFNFINVLQMQISVELVGGGMIGSCDPFDLYLRKSGSLGCVDIVFNWTVASNHSKQILIDGPCNFLTWYHKLNFYFRQLLFRRFSGCSEMYIIGLRKFIFTAKPVDNLKSRHLRADFQQEIFAKTTDGSSEPCRIFLH